MIKSLNLEMKSGQIHGIVGLNGTGKTTLLNTIFGLKKADNGDINFDGSQLTKQQITYLLTENFFYTGISGREYLSLFKNLSFETDRWNELFLLPLDKLIDEYSSGMKKKLALLGILKQDKPILILDEPFNSLDIESSRIIRSILLKIREKGKTIILTSHILETLTNLCDYIHVLESGKIGSTREKVDFKEFEQELFQAIEHKNEELISDLTGSKSSESFQD